MITQSLGLQLFLCLSFSVSRGWAFDNARYDNVASYWGQNSYGATHSDEANYQKRLSHYCQDDSIDVIPIAFVNSFFSTGGLPVLHLANICNPVDHATFPGSNLVDCRFLQEDIELCQARGKILTISLGGAGGSVGFSGDEEGRDFADTLWNLFLGGSSDVRPFGTASLDGVDLDIESGSSTGYAALVNRLRSRANGWGKKLYVTAAPQCVYPDAALQGVLNEAFFDAIYVQFYNNPCSLPHANEANNWNYGLWDYWARHISPNKDVKVYVAAPAASLAAGSGYVDIGTLSNIAVRMRNSFPSFGGVALWDSSQAYANDHYETAIKNTLVAAGGTGFTYPKCSEPEFSSGTAYTGGSRVTFNGYIWQAKWWAQSTPQASEHSDWQPMSACSGSGTTSAPGPGPTGGSCAGVAEWSSNAIYSGGMTAVHNGRLYRAKWWTQGETPGSASVWEDQGACSARSNAKSGKMNEPMRQVTTKTQEKSTLPTSTASSSVVKETALDPIQSEEATEATKSSKWENGPGDSSQNAAASSSLELESTASEGSTTDSDGSAYRKRKSRIFRNVI